MSALRTHGASLVVRSFRAVADRPLADAALQLAEQRPWPDDRLVVLTYHRVTDVVDDGRYVGLVSATPDEMAVQLRLVAERYHPVSIDEVIAAVRGEHRLPTRAVLVSFDDAVDDFADHVLPLLRSADVPAVLFVPTAFVGEPNAFFWWDALYAALTRTERLHELETPAGKVQLDTPGARCRAYRRLRSHCLQLPTREAVEMAVRLSHELDVPAPRASVMTWDQLRAAEASGVRCCAHSRSHAHLDAISPAAARAEVEGSIEDLRRELGSVTPAFAYPAGLVSAEVRRIVAEAGVEVAFTTRRGANDLGRDDALLLRRTNVSRRSGVGAVRLQLAPTDRLFRR